MTEPQLVDSKLERKYALAERQVIKAEADESSSIFELEDKMAEIEEQRNELRRDWLEWARRQRTKLSERADELADKSIEAWNNGDDDELEDIVTQWVDAQADIIHLIQRMRPVERALDETQSEARILYPWQQEAVIYVIRDRYYDEVLDRWVWYFGETQGELDKLTADRLQGRQYAPAGKHMSYEDNNPPQVT